MKYLISVFVGCKKFNLCSRHCSQRLFW